MRPKPTFKSGRHPSREKAGGWLSDCVVSEATHQALAKALGREPAELAASEKEFVREGVAFYARIFCRTRKKAEPSAADTRATLEAIKSLPTQAAALDAFRKCDINAATLITAALRRQLPNSQAIIIAARDGWPQVPGSDNLPIRDAAAAALSAMRTVKGRRGYGLALFAKFVWNAWLRLGGSSDAKAHRGSDESNSSLLAFGVVLQGAMLESALESVDPSDLAKSIREAQK